MTNPWQVNSDIKNRGVVAYTAATPILTDSSAFLCENIGDAQGGERALQRKQEFFLIVLDKTISMQYFTEKD